MMAEHAKTDNSLQSSSHRDETMMMVVLVVIISFFISMLVYLRRRRQRPLPPAALSAGYFKTMSILNSSNAPWWMLQNSRSVGSIYRLNLLIPGTQTIVVSDPKVARDILMDTNSTKPYLVYSGFARFLGGKSIVTTNGPTWKHARKGVSGAFASTHVKNMSRVCKKHLQDWIQETLEIKVQRGEPLDVAHEMLGLVTKVIAESAMEYEITEAEIKFFLAELEIALVEFLRTEVGNPLRLVFGPLVPGVRRAKLATARLRRLATKMLESYRIRQQQRVGNNRINSSSNTSVIARIIDNPHYASDYDRVTDILVFLVAGHDTTAYSAAWILLELARNPKEQTKLRNAFVSASAGDDNDSNRSLSYLDCVIREGLRLHPVAAMGSVRTAAQDFSAGPYIIPKGSTVFVHLLSLHRNPQYYENPDALKPSRWLTNCSSIAFMPFSLGPRNCVGQSLAMAELRVMVSTLCAKYSFEVANEGRVDHFLTLKPVGTMLMARHVVENYKKKKS